MHQARDRVVEFVQNVFEHATALLEHRRILRDTIARHGGVEVDTQGDAFFIAFPTAPGAVKAAAESQEALAEQFNVSRIPIRDALRLLEAEGLVFSGGRTRMTVSKLSAEDLEELYEMRTALEPVIARVATPKMRTCLSPS